MAKKKLILLTAEFPFGKSETFLETEVLYLADAFEQVVIIPSEKVLGEPRKLPDNVCTEKPEYSIDQLNKAGSMKGLFHRLFLYELIRMIIIYRLFPSPKRIKTALVSLFRGKQIAVWLEQRIDNDSNTILYSYWCNDAAIVLSLYKRKHPAIKTVARAHGWDLYFEASQIRYLPYRKLITDKLDIVCPVSEVGVRYVSEKWKIKNPGNIKLARLGVEAQQPQTALPGVFTIVSCSNLIPLKRVHLIIEALSLIDTIPIRWVHFGDGPLFEELNDLAQRILPLNISWKFMGRIPNQELLQWYRENPVSVFINASETEGVPVSIMEAMSFGIPVIATNVGGNSEIVNSENGYLVEDNISPPELAEIIKSFINLSSTLKETKQVASFETSKMMYNADDNFSQFVKKIQDL